MVNIINKVIKKCKNKSKNVIKTCKLYFVFYNK